MIFSNDCLAGRTIFITGGSSGLGRAAAQHMARCGARIVISGRDPDRLEATRSSLPGEGHAAVAADLVSVDDTAALVKSVAKEHGPLDGILHSAGVSLTLPVRMTKQHHVDEVFRSSVMGAYGVLSAAAQKNVMTDSSAVIFLSSISAIKGYGGMMVYGGAKSAVHGMVKSAAVELAPKKIRVNAIVCGSVYTEMYARHVDKMGEQWIADIAARHPLGFGEPEDVTNATIFLMSDAGKWITGTLMTVDGGYTA